MTEFWINGVRSKTNNWERDCEITDLREKGLTLQAIGDRYGLHRERIRAIVATMQRRQRMLEYERRLEKTWPWKPKDIQP